MAALAILLQTETDFGGRMGFALAWGVLNFFFIALLRRPALSGALSLTLVVLLVLLSRLLGVAAEAGAGGSAVTTALGMNEDGITLRSGVAGLEANGAT